MFSIKNTFTASVLMLGIGFSVHAKGHRNTSKHVIKPANQHGFALMAPKVSGCLKLDQRFFLGSKNSRGDEFASGAIIRSFCLGFDGKLAPDFSYSMGLEFDASEKKVEVDDAYVTYTGFGNNLEVSLGRVNPSFSLENTSSTKWLPLLEKSMPASAFGVSPGLGVSAVKWDNDYSISVALTQPSPSDKKNYANSINKSDRWTLSSRATKLFTFDDFKIQAGISGYVANDSGSKISFSAYPEARARGTKEVINTGDVYSNRHYAGALELAMQRDSLYCEIEYHLARVRAGASNIALVNGKLYRFSGYQAQVAYVLTGESRAYNPKTGIFGQVKPAGNTGAWEVAARLSNINLNNSQVQGGKADNFGLGLNYYYNNNLAFFADYIISKQHPSKMIQLSNALKRNLNIFSLRMQLVF